MYTRSESELSSSSENRRILDRNEEGTSGSHTRANTVETNLDTTDDEEVILCVYYKKYKLSATAYFIHTSEMYLMYDVADLAPDFRYLQTLFLQLKPTQVVTCPTQPDHFLRKLHSLITGEEVPISPSADPPSFCEKLRFISAKEFQYETCCRSLLDLRLPGSEDMSQPERHAFVAASINMAATGLVSSAGAMLFWLNHSLARLRLDNTKPVLLLRTLTLKNLVWVSEETLNSLQIFNMRAHPSLFKWGEGMGGFRNGHQDAPKEGLSVFSLINRCFSSPGARFMRVMLSQPTNDLSIIEKRHEVIAFCLNPLNEQEVKTLVDSIGHIKPVMKVLVRMTNAEASVGNWRAFYYTIFNSVIVAELCQKHANEVKFFKQISDSLSDSTFIISHCINRTMDFEQSKSQNRIVIKYGISEELDALKKRYADVPRIMDQVAAQELQHLPDFVDYCTMVYITEMGYVLGLPMWAPDLTEEQLDTLPNLQYKYKTEDMAHYKSARCCELDDSLGDVQMNILELESRIVLKLAQYIQANVKPLVELTNLIAELDCLMSFAMAARDYGLVKPTLVKEKQISIIKGRHILKEQQEDVFVPNDTVSSEETGQIKILTGPNASGKSIYLKQVAIIVYLAHVGCYVPAEKATIGVIDQLHTRVQNIEAINLRLSSFMTDFQQMLMALRNCTGNSLLFFDEFGIGTSELDGLAILAACLEHFINLEDCPHVFLSTHFHSLISRLPESPRVKLQYLDHMMDKGELVYLYRLKDGQSPGSFAIQVAEMEEFPKKEIQHAKTVFENLRLGKDLRAKKNSKLTQKKKQLYNKHINEELLISIKNEVMALKKQPISQNNRTMLVYTCVVGKLNKAM